MNFKQFHQNNACEEYFFNIILDDHLDVKNIVKSKDH